MIKNSTIIIAVSIIIAGILANGIIVNIFKQQIQKGQRLHEQEIKKMEINQKIIDIEPQVLLLNNSTILYMPNISLKNGSVDLDYTLYKYEGENQELIKIPIKQ